MLTYLSSPKPFKGIDKENQYRAIKSWLQSAKDVEVILYGDSEGIEFAGVDLNVTVIKEIESSESGVPLFGAIAKHASVYGKYDVQVYLNCDILISRLFEVSLEIEYPKFLCIGQRIDLNEGCIVNSAPNTYKSILNDLFNSNLIALHETTGIDYFMFKRNMWENIKPIAIGRGGYDNALLNFCKKNEIPIIDCTLSMLAIHQFHDYNHVTGNKNTVFYGVEAKKNLEIAGRYSLLTVSDADYILKDSKLIKNSCRGDFIRKLELDMRYKYKQNKFSLLIRTVWRVLFYFEMIKISEYKISDIIID